MSMTENLKGIGYRYYKLYQGEFHTGYMIFGGKKMYLGASWQFWSPSKYNLLWNRKKEVARSSLFGVILRPARTNNEKKGEVL